MQALGQVTSSVEKQELIQLETTLTNLFNYKEQLVLNPNMITTHTTEEMDVDIEVIKAQIQIIKTKKAERLMFRAEVKWHEEGEKNNA